MRKVEQAKANGWQVETVMPKILLWDKRNPTRLLATTRFRTCKEAREHFSHKENIPLQYVGASFDKGHNETNRQG